MQRLFLAASPAALAFFTPLSLHAEETAPTDQLVVTGSPLSDRDLADLTSPGFGVGIGQDQLAAINRINVEDSLRYAPNLVVRKRYIGDNNAPLALRGSHHFQTARALVSVDGFTLSNFLGSSFDTAPKWGVVAPGDIEHVDVIYGPASARYSGHSLGGTVRLVGRDITDNASRAHGQLMHQGFRYYGSDLSLAGYAIDVGVDQLIGDRGAVTVSYRHGENEGQPMQWRRVGAGTPYADQAIIDAELGFPLRIASADSVVRLTEEQLRLRGTYALTGQWIARALAGLSWDKEDTTDPVSFLRDEAGMATFVGISGVREGKDTRQELLVGTGVSGPLGGWDTDLTVSRFEVLDAVDRQSDSADLVTGIVPVSGQVTDGAGTGWTNAEFIAERTLGGQGIAVGASFAGYTLEGLTYATDRWRGGGDAALRDGTGGRTQLMGLFLEDELALSSQLTLTAGVRAEAWRAQDGFLIHDGMSVQYPSRSRQAVSPKLALGYAPDDRWSFGASLARGVRFPTVGELYQADLIQYGANIGNLDLNGFNPDLVPEDALDLQLVATRTFPSAVLTVTAYRQAVDDAIFTQSIAVPDADGAALLVQESVSTNIGQVVTQGVDVVLSTADLWVTGLSLDANLSYLESEITKNPLNNALEGNVFPRIPKWRANISMRYQPTPNWDLAAGWRYQDTPFRNIENTANAKCGTFFCVSSFSQLDVKATRRVGDLAFSLGADNVFDENAFVFHPFPGRTMFFEMRWEGGRP